MMMKPAVRDAGRPNVAISALRWPQDSADSSPGVFSPPGLLPTALSSPLPPPMASDPRPLAEPLSGPESVAAPAEALTSLVEGVRLTLARSSLSESAVELMRDDKVEQNPAPSTVRVVRRISRPKTTKLHRFFTVCSHRAFQLSLVQGGKEKPCAQHHISPPQNATLKSKSKNGNPPKKTRGRTGKKHAQRSTKTIPGLTSAPIFNLYKSVGNNSTQSEKNQNVSPSSFCPPMNDTMFFSSPIDGGFGIRSPTLHIVRRQTNFKKSCMSKPSFIDSLRSAVAPTSLIEDVLTCNINQLSPESTTIGLTTYVTAATPPAAIVATPDRSFTMKSGMTLEVASNSLLKAEEIRFLPLARQKSLDQHLIMTSMDVDDSTTPNTRRILESFEAGSFCFGRGNDKDTNMELPVNWPPDVVYTDDYDLASVGLTRLPPIDTVTAARLKLEQFPPKPRAHPHARITRITDPRHPANGQFGLFATADLHCGQHVVDYIGEVIRADDDRVKTSDYVLDFGGGGEGIRISIGGSADAEVRLAIDGARVGNEGRMVNDFRGVPAPPDYTHKSFAKKKSANPEYAGFANKSKANVEFRCYINRSCCGEMRMGLFVCDARGIKRGQELLVSYGKGYWASRGLDLGSMYYALS
ncbi:hypothetical protein HDU83_004013 [Entophlyctis luteolus]|nr:hypothetical protein HDU83_004013 [Entophlyctis luteolus]